MTDLTVKYFSGPRVRGDEPAKSPGAGRGNRVFPACAGMNRPVATLRMAASGVPRVRGDEPSIDAIITDPP